jgi:uncharacterized membrane protein
MTLLILGLLLWTAAHLFKRLRPAERARLGDAGKGLVAVAVVASVVLMVIGYRGWNAPVFWGRSPAMTGINNLLMLFAVYLYAASGMKTALARRIRHPQLTAIKVWAVAHLLVNGDLASIVLFGGLLAWAVAEVILINRAERVWTRPDPAPTAKEVQAVIGTLLVYGLIAGVHTWLGYSPFG